MTVKKRIAWIFSLVFIPLFLSGCNGVTYTALTAGDWHACALTGSGTVQCWGDNAKGQLGDGSSIPVSTLSVEVSRLSGVSSIAAAASHTCALTDAGAVECWGENEKGQLGDGTIVNRNGPVPVAGLAGSVKQISVNENGGCAALASGASHCWGDKSQPEQIPAAAQFFSQIAQNQDHGCGITGAGGVLCWGRNTSGQLGDGTTTDSPNPVAVAGLSSGVSTVVVGAGFSCVLTHSGAVECWGDNHFSQLGSGSDGDSLTPVIPQGLSTGVTQLIAGANFACALTTSGKVLCWGTIDQWNNTVPSQIH